ncbi:MAG: right-handed parallel beta-helix repeat-containing protein, partial [Bacteroidia bacterium]
MKQFASFIATLVLLLAASCERDPWLEGPVSLKPSTDTLWFDTLFTRKPGSTYPISVTKIISIRNPENAWIKADFELAGGAQSPFRINVDGVAGTLIEGLEIAPRDSVFVFVQCSLEPNNSTQPAIVLDSILARVGGKESRVILSAWGWDAHYVQDSVLPCNTRWILTDKPYVIVGDVWVRSGCTFRIDPGVQIYASARTVLYVAGQLDWQGSPGAPIRIRGDIPSYKTDSLPNQWGGIYLLRNSGNSILKHCDLRNASVGIRVDSLPLAGGYNLSLENTRISYCGQACVAGISAHINAVNCLFSDAGSYTFLGLLGGQYNLVHCTLADNGRIGGRQKGHFTLTNCLRDGLGRVVKTQPLQCTITNCIVEGPQWEELQFDADAGVPFSLNFGFNLIRTRNEGGTLPAS